MVKAVIFDLWGTLFYDVFPYPAEFAKRLGKKVDKYNYVEDYDYVKAFERNLMLAPYENLRTPVTNLLIELKIEPAEKLVSELVGIIHKGAEDQKSYAQTLKVLKNLKENGYKLGLISNTDDYSFKHLKNRYHLDKFFDAMLISYDTGIIKPAPEIFQLMIDKLGVGKDEVLMVGDSLEDDAIAAEQFGMKGVLIDRNNRRPEYPNRITSLSQLNKFLD